MLRNLKTILWKNFTIRKRHWLLTIAECFVPTILFLVMTYARSNVSGLNKVYVNESTYHDVQTMENIYSHLDVGSVKLWYAPNTEEAEGIIKRVQKKLGIAGEDVREFYNRTDMLSYEQFKQDSYVAAVIFNKANNSSLDYDLTIYNKYLHWNTDKLFVPFLSTEENKHSSYFAKGYAALQIAIDISYIEQFDKNVQIPTISLQQFPDPPHIEDSKLNKLFVQFLPAVTIFSFILLCPVVLQKVCEEKASGTKELMKMVGLKSSQIWLGWFIYALVTNIISIIITVVLMKVPLWGVPYSLIEHSEGTVLFVFLFLYCMAAITSCFLIANIFKIPFIATVCGIIFWILSYFLPHVINSFSDVLLWRYKILFCVFPNVALFYGYNAMSVYEMREIGLQWSNLFEAGSGNSQDVTIGEVFVMLVFEIVFFMLLTIYIENVNPGKYGIPKSLNFPIKTIYKQFVSYTKIGNNNSSSIETLLPTGKSIDEEQVFPKVQINNLKKVYSDRVAIDGLDLDIQDKTITVLLGENGAGKTTTMSILSGMINATSGSVFVNGKDIKKRTDEVRQMMGLCPQHNLLFNDLTVYEHLYFFAKLRDLNNSEADIDSLLKRLDLYEKKSSLPNTLSGGMKRKLCLALALIGNSEVLILDEPTSGMDPESRRKIWDLLQERRKSETILISTHFMEEAEAIGDQIVIMANGRVQSMGTPTYLKTKYNTGYNLSLVMKSKETSCHINPLVTKYFADAKIKQETHDSIMYLLPFAENKDYSKMLAELEQDSNITEINIKASTMNDVILKAKDDNDGTVEDSGYRLCVLLKSKQHTFKIRRIVKQYFPEVKVLREDYNFIIYFLPHPEICPDPMIFKLKSQQEKLDILSVTVNVTSKHTGFPVPHVSNEHVQKETDLCLVLKSIRSAYLINKLVKEIFPKAQKVQEQKNHILYSLPLKQHNNCKKLISTLEEKTDEWDIFSINMDGRPEGVYFKLEDESNKTDLIDTAKTAKDLKGNIWTTFAALLLKRWYFLKHTSRWFSFSILVTILIFCLAIFLVMLNNNIYRTNKSSLKLSLDTYGNTKVYYGTNSPNATKAYKLNKHYEKLLQHGHLNSMSEASLVSKSAFVVSEAIIQEGLNNFAFYKKNIIVAAEFNSTENDSVLVNAMYSSEALHGIPISINLVTNAIVKFLINEDVSITIRNTPIMPLKSQLTPSELSVVDVSSIWLMLIPISFFFFGSYFIVFPHSEVSTNFFKLQINCGVNTWIYWLNNIFVDFIFSMGLMVVLGVLLYCCNFIVFNSNVYTLSEICAIIAIFGVYITTSLPFTYLFSYQKTVCGGLALFFIIGVLFGSVPTLIIASIELSKDNDCGQVLDYLKKLLPVLSPQFGLSNVILKFSKKYVDNFNWKVMDPVKKTYICKAERNPCCEDLLSTSCKKYQSYFQNEELGIQFDLLFMVAAFVMYFVILLLLNCQGWTKLKHKYNSLKNKETLKFGPVERNTALLVKKLKKMFKNKPIVNHLNFNLIKNQCFGLLGVNGAGKSTTFAMLTKHMMFDEGTVQLNDDKNKLLNIQDPQYNKYISYCPQDNSLNFFLTGRELLFSLAILKGYSWEKAKEITNYWLEKFGLTKYADKPCYQYSGGNKRKLNTSLAFLGNPKLIFLDEPTSGVDPVSQRKFWRVLSDAKKSLKSTFLLCSHSMEECETLCDQIAIMKEGQIKKEGSLLYLKTAFQNKVKVTIELKGRSVNTTEVIQEASKLFQGKLKKYHGNTFIFEVGNNRFSELFSTIDDLKAKYPKDFKNCLIDSMSLEDVFLTVAETIDENEI